MRKSKANFRVGSESVMGFPPNREWVTLNPLDSIIPPAAPPSPSGAGDDGLARGGCLITAGVRCAPPGNKPAREELDACRRYLAREIALAENTRVVVALGQIAFRAFLKAWREAGGVAPGRG